MFFILLIGMISLTSMASTSLTEQKQKTTFCKALVSPVVESVVNECQIATLFTNIVQLNNKVVQFRNVTVTETFLVIIADVGWKISKQTFKEIPYSEKLLENYKLPFVAKRCNPNKLIRIYC